MKRFLCLVLMLALCLSISAFAEEKDYSKYADLFDMLEAGQYDSARAYIDQLAAPQQETAAVTEIEITSENWADYFEIKEEVCWMSNDFDEVVDACWAQVLCVREEWADKIDLEATDVAFEYSYQYARRFYKFDIEAHTFEFLGHDGLPDAMETETFRTDKFLHTDIIYNGMHMTYPANTVYSIRTMGECGTTDGKPTIHPYENIFITRAAGTLVIAE